MFNTLFLSRSFSLSSPTPSIIHSCAYKLVEELIKYDPFLFLYVSKLLTMKIIIRYQELFVWNVNFWLTNIFFIFSASKLLVAEWFLFSLFQPFSVISICIFISIHVNPNSIAKLSTYVVCLWALPLPHPVLFFEANYCRGLRKLQEERLWCHPSLINSNVMALPMCMCVCIYIYIYNRSNFTCIFNKLHKHCKNNRTFQIINKHSETNKHYIIFTYH
jgi:hypothetical protein